VVPHGPPGTLVGAAFDAGLDEGCGVIPVPARPPHPAIKPARITSAAPRRREGCTFSRMPDLSCIHWQRLLAPRPLRHRHKLVHVRRISLVAPNRIPEANCELLMNHGPSDSDPKGLSGCSFRRGVTPGRALGIAARSVSAENSAPRHSASQAANESADRSSSTSDRAAGLDVDQQGVGVVGVPAARREVINPQHHRGVRHSGLGQRTDEPDQRPAHLDGLTGPPAMPRPGPERQRERRNTLANPRQSQPTTPRITAYPGGGRPGGHPRAPPTRRPVPWS